MVVSLERQELVNGRERVPRMTLETDAATVGQRLEAVHRGVLIHTHSRVASGLHQRESAIGRVEAQGGIMSDRRALTGGQDEQQVG